MASKFGMAGGIPERRVRPIWDAVDSRQFKSALKQSTSLLAKYPNSPYALALKAVILERMGKPDEALAVCLNAKELLYSDGAVQIDDLTLSTLQIVLQRLDRLDMATSCYEYACGKFPNNLELMMGLFNCYVREYSFVKQQQTAIKMYKIVGEERFLLWTVCSIQLQVFCGDGEGKLLHLAEALLKKHIASHNLHEPEALLVYISVLEEQAKYGAALETLSGSLGSLLILDIDKLRMQGRLLARACDYAAAAEIFQKVLESCPDDWESFLHYLDCLLEHDMSWSKGTITGQINPPAYDDLHAFKSPHLTDAEFDARISSANCFVQKLQMATTNDFIRCPYLASLEIEKRRRLYRKADGDKLMDVLLEYFCRFGHLACFASDVEMFLRILKYNEKSELLEKCKKICESPSTTPLKTLGQAISIFKIQELLGVIFNLPIGELEGTAIQMVAMYCENLSISKDLDPQENMHGEELLTMACNVLVQLFWRTRHLGYLLEAIMILEFGLTIRRYVWQYKISLVHLYSHFGALPLAYEWYKTLEIKNILLESASHHILPQMLKSPLWSDLTDLLKDYLKFMDDHFREAADLSFLAYRHRNYSKVIEFVQFKERLQHSHQYIMARLESPILQIKQTADNIVEVECILENVNYGIQVLELSSDEQCKSLTFNEDMQSRPWWSPTPDENYLLGPFDGRSFCPSENMQQEAQKRESSIRKGIERRSLLPRLIYLSIHSASSIFKEKVETNGPIFDNKRVAELRSLLERYATSLGFPFQDAIKVIIEISEGKKSFADFSLDMVDWVNFAVFVNAWNLGSHNLGLPDIGDGCMLDSWIVVDGLIKKCIYEHLISAKLLLTSPGGNLPIFIQLVTESFAWHGLVIRSCIRSLIPSGKKKKKSNAVDHNSPISHSVKNSLHCLFGAIEEITKWLEEQTKRPADENLDSLLSHLQRNGSDEGPGHSFKVMESSSATLNPDLGDRISQALQSWNSVDVARKIVVGQHKTLFEFHGICESKLKSICALKQSI